MRRESGGEPVQIATESETSAQSCGGDCPTFAGIGDLVVEKEGCLEPEANWWRDAAQRRRTADGIDAGGCSARMPYCTPDQARGSLSRMTRARRRGTSEMAGCDGCGATTITAQARL